MKRFLLGSLLLFALALFSTLFFDGAEANAASSFDNPLLTTTLKVNKTGGGCTSNFNDLDVTNTWLHDIQVLGYSNYTGHALAYSTYHAITDTTTFKWFVLQNPDHTYTVMAVKGGTDSYTFANGNANTGYYANQRFMYVSNAWTAGNYFSVTIAADPTCTFIQGFDGTQFMYSNYPDGWAVPIFTGALGSGATPSLLFNNQTFIPPSSYAGTTPPTSTAPPAVNVNYTPQFSISGSKTQFVATYTSKTTTPATTLPDPVQLNWSVIDKDQACPSGGTPTDQCVFARLGYVDVCPDTLLPIAKSYDNSYCSGFTFLPDHHYYVTGGVGYGLATDTTIPGYNITYLTNMFYLDQANTNLDAATTSCNSTSGDVYYGVANICTSSKPIDCTLNTNFIQQLSCATNQQFSHGLINPSLNAFKTLIASFIVPSHPSCSIPLTDFRFTGGQVFPMSGFGPSICSKTAQVRNTFPLMVLIVNFSLAFGLFVIIVRIFNRLTNPDKTNIIEGV